MFDHKIKKTKKLHLVQKEHICNKKNVLQALYCSMRNKKSS